MKPGKRGKKGSASENNSSFSDGPSPYGHGDREHMLKAIENTGKHDAELHINTDSNEHLKKFNSVKGSESTKPKKNGKLQPIFKSNGKLKTSPKSRSHYGKFPKQGSISKPGSKKVRSGSGDNRRHPKLNPIKKPSKR